MAKHKAPTQITIASTHAETPLHDFVERYWKLAALVAVIATIAALVPKYTSGKARQAHAGAWDELRTQANLGEGLMGFIQGGSPDALALFADQHKDRSIGAWAKALEVGAHVQAKELDEAQKAAAQIGQLWPDHLLARAKVFSQGEGEPVTLEEAIRSGSAALAAWEQEHANLFRNPELPADAPKVRLNTSQGPIVVGLYSDRAPQHVENFLKLAREGAYDGTKFHRVVRGSLVQGGDPSTVAGEPDSWGSGGTPNALEPELDSRLRHFKGALAAWKAPGDRRSHGSQFLLTTADQHQMDGQTVVFGMVLEGLDTLEAIESGAVVGDRPQDPAVIQSVEIL